MDLHELLFEFLNFLSFFFGGLLQGPSVALKETVKASDSLPMPAGGSDGLAREDISGKITPTLLKSFGSPDWKVFSVISN